MTTPEQTAYILERAAEIVEEGWCQGNDEFAGRHCILGAVNVATGMEPGHYPSCAGLAALRRTQKTTGYDNLWIWNDEHGRTKAEVVCALLDTAASLRGGA